MIIQRLCELYEQLQQAPATGTASALAPYGYSAQKVSLIVVLTRDGVVHDIEDARQEEDQGAQNERPRRGNPRMFPRTLIVPAIPGRTVAVTPGFLCDSTAYMLGIGPETARPQRVKECFAAFRKRHLELRDQIKDDGFRAVCKFLESWSPRLAKDYPIVAEAAGGFGVFQLRGREQFVHDSTAVREFWEAQLQNTPASGEEPSNDIVEIIAPSLVSGRSEPLARLHDPAIKGVLGAQTSGAKLASFNCAAFESYGKSQTYNAPVGTRDAFRYCTALNHLLAGDRHRVRVGDTSVVFWTESPRAVECFGQVIGGTAGQDETLVNDLHRWAEAARRGMRTELGDSDTPFYVLGLSPNAARLSVRFWIPSTIGEVMTRLAAHTEALELADPPPGYSPPTLLQIARETVSAKAGWPDDDRIPPRLVGELGRAVLHGLPYPGSLLGAVVARARTDGWVNEDERTEGPARVGHRRACIIAACLRRQDQEISMSLNENGTRPYQLGRLFALLDTIAEDASGKGVNRRDKYFAAASANPVTVFPRLLRLSTFDLKKIGAENPGYRITREQSVQSVCDRIDTFPSNLTLEEQGHFCLGYYQQRQSIFTPRAGTEA